MRSTASGGFGESTCSNSLGPPLKTSQSGSGGPPDGGLPATWQISAYPRQHLLQVCKELLPPSPRAAVGLLLIRPEAQLLHAQESPLARCGERKGHHTLQIVGRIVM